MDKKFIAEFDNVDPGEGVLDIAIRLNTKNGDWELYIEENGMPVSVPEHVLVGALGCVIKRC
ncbi:hypothetical protein [Paenibacillus alkalitolerans]|uniref:hypothetical protein n=1 Tax=Paenibacillus alkalitolerans TaxID=2799335 RepID=UPI0018F6D4C1|nr:hypothetical protein [Paenibacillus alkalitolerans]